MRKGGSGSWEGDLQLADACHCPLQEHQEHPGRHGCLAFLIAQPAGRQVGGHQGGGAGCVGGDAGAGEAVGVGDSADQEVHAVASGHVA